jgi:hypothetical protein
MVVAEAKPLIVLVVARTCFKSMYTVEFAAIAVVVCKSTSSSNRVNVPADEAVLATAMLVITVVVDDGTVYSVALDVAADVRTSAFDTVAISYYPSFVVDRKYFLL